METIEFTSDKKQNEIVFEKLSKCRPFKRLVTYFDAENILLTPYREVTDDRAVLVIESYDREVVAIKGCNCGYLGEGPRRTQRVLEFLGIPKELSEQFKLYSGIDIEFNEDGTFKKDSVKLDCVFDSRAATPQNGKILIGKDTIFSNMSTRQIFFLNPQYMNFFYLMKAIALIDPLQLSYYIGEDNRKYADFYFDNYNKKLEYLMYGSYVIISSDAFDIVCFVDQNVAMTFVNTIHMIITGQKLFFETSVGELACFHKDAIEYYSSIKKSKMLLSYLFGKSKPAECYDMINLKLRG